MAAMPLYLLTAPLAVEKPTQCRSHGVLVISVSTPCGDSSDALVTGKLNLIDLVGNEDNRRSCNEGIRLQESGKINQSLFVLSNMIYALNNNKSHVPYRESKLTRILQDSLGGMSRALMVVCLNPGEYQDKEYTKNGGFWVSLFNQTSWLRSVKRSNMYQSSIKAKAIAPQDLDAKEGASINLFNNGAWMEDMCSHKIEDSKAAWFKSSKDYCLIISEDDSIFTNSSIALPDDSSQLNSFSSLNLAAEDNTGEEIMAADKGTVSESKTYLPGRQYWKSSTVEVLSTWQLTNKKIDNGIGH